MGVASSLLKDFGEIDQSTDPRIGSATTTSNSAVTLLTTIVPSLSLALLVALFVTFIGRRYIPEVYGSKPASACHERGSRSGCGPICSARDLDLVRLRGLDSYLLLRYLKLCVLLSSGGCLFLCSVLLPLNATAGGGMSHLDVLTIANVETGSARLYAHPCCAAAFFGWVMYMVARERMFYVALMDAYHAIMERSGSSETKTLLFTNVPKGLLEADKIRVTVGRDKDVQVWLVTDTSALRRCLKRRAAIMDKIDTIVQKISRGRLPSDTEKPGSGEGDTRSETVSSAAVAAPAPSSSSDVSALSSLCMRVASLDIEGRQRLHHELCKENHRQTGAADNQQEYKQPTFKPCAIVRFGSVRDASIAYHSRHHEDLSYMSPRSVGTGVDDMLWENLGLLWWQSLSRRMLARVLTAAMIVFWSFPVALVTAMTNVDMLLPSASWQTDLPAVIRSALRGLLPSLALSLIMALPPRIIARLMRFSGCVTLAEVEIGLQRYYFAFRVVQVFLVAALGATASSVLAQIYSDPSSATAILAKRLPGGSNFYLSYIVVQSLSETAFVLLNVEGLFTRRLLSKMFDDTPRKRRRRQGRLFQISSGTVFATCSSLLVIAMTYAPLAPLMLSFAAFAFSMFYLVYRHNLFATADTVAHGAGALYETALQHILVGLYIGELCLVGILTVASVGDRRIGGPLILSCALLVGTVTYQKASRDMFKPWRDRFLGRTERVDMLPRYEKGRRQNLWRFLSSIPSRARRLFIDDFAVVRRDVEEACLSPLGSRVQTQEYLAPEIVQRESAIELAAPLEIDAPKEEDAKLQVIARISAGGDTQLCYCPTSGKIKITREAKHASAGF